MEDSIVYTKQKIQQTALELFSKKGYHAVSIRDICKVVGIKESTVYYHFKNKKDILDSLLSQVTKLTDTKRDLFDNTFMKISDIDINAFIMVAVNILENYLLEPTVYKLISMLTIEKLTDQQAEAMYHELTFNTPLRQQEIIFTLMTQKKLFKQEDARFLADEYYSKIYYVFQKYFCGCSISDDSKEKARTELSVHMTKFFSSYYYKGDAEYESIQKQKE